MNPVELFPARIASRVVKAKEAKEGVAAAGGYNPNTDTAFVPATDSAFARTVRLHEAAHAIWSRTTSPRPEDLVGQAIEDIKIHQHLETEGSVRRDELFTAIQDVRTTAKRIGVKGDKGLQGLQLLRAASILRKSGEYTDLGGNVHLTSEVGNSSLVETVKKYHPQGIEIVDSILAEVKAGNFAAARALVSKFMTGKLAEEQEQPEPPQGEGQGEEGEGEGQEGQEGQQKAGKGQSKSNGKQDKNDQPKQDKKEKQDQPKQDQPKNDQPKEEKKDESKDQDKQTDGKGKESKEEESDEEGDNGSEGSEGDESEDDQDGDEGDEGDDQDGDPQESKQKPTGGEQKKLDRPYQPKATVKADKEEIVPFTSYDKAARQEYIPAPIKKAETIHQLEEERKDGEDGQVQVVTVDENLIPTSRKGVPHPQMFVHTLSPNATRKVKGRGRNEWKSVTQGLKIRANRLALNAASPTGGSRLFETKGLGGTVLIDASGSMNISDKILYEIAEKVPAGQVAYYSGRTDSSTFYGDVNDPADIEEWSGDLVVYAKHGKIRKDNGSRLPKRHGGNFVDYHALLWLNKQPGPRYLMTDMEFTGPLAGEARKLCKELEAKKRITRFHDMDSLMEMVRAKK